MSLEKSLNNPEGCGLQLSGAANKYPWAAVPVVFSSCCRYPSKETPKYGLVLHWWGWSLDHRRRGTVPGQGWKVSHPSDSVAYVFVGSPKDWDTYMVSKMHCFCSKRWGKWGCFLVILSGTDSRGRLEWNEGAVEQSLKKCLACLGLGQQLNG